MILINKNASNDVILTLKEKSAITGDSYNLFVIEDKLNHTEKIFTCPDLSNHKERYNHFYIRENFSFKDNENLLNGIIYLSGNTSQYTYKIYESDVPFSSDTLSVYYTNAIVLEQGILNTFGQEGQNTINSVYL